MSRYTKLENFVTSDQQEAIQQAVGLLMAEGCPITPEILKNAVQGICEQLGCPLPPYLIVNRFMTRHGFQRYPTIVWTKPTPEEITESLLPPAKKNMNMNMKEKFSCSYSNSCSCYQEEKEEKEGLK